MRATRLVVALFVAAIATPAVAQTQAPPPAPPARRAAAARLAAGPFRPTLRQLRGLKLTAEQRQQVKDIFKSHQPELKALAQSFRAARQKWQRSGQIDIQERKDLMAQRQAIMKTVHDQVLQLLTPEQQKQLQARRRR